MFETCWLTIVTFWGCVVNQGCFCGALDAFIKKENILIDRYKDYNY